MHICCCDRDPAVLLVFLCFLGIGIAVSDQCVDYCCGKEQLEQFEWRVIRSSVQLRPGNPLRSETWLRGLDIFLIHVTPLVSIVSFINVRSYKLSFCLSLSTLSFPAWRGDRLASLEGGGVFLGCRFMVELFSNRTVTTDTPLFPPLRWGFPGR